MVQRNGSGGATGEKPRSVLVSGASFAGLAAAWWMRTLGYSVTIIEIGRGLKKGGTPVDIREGVIDVVKRMGLLERIAAHSLKERPMQFLDAQGAPLGMMPNEAEDGPDREQGYEIERNDLLDMLFDEIKDDVEFLFGDNITALEQSTEDVTVIFASGEHRTFSLVLGCDGTHSAVRRMCFDKERSFLFFLQVYFSLTVVDKLLIRENTSQMFTVPGKSVMLNAYNGKTDIGFGFSSKHEIAYDRRSQDEQKQIICDAFEGGAWRTGELLDEMVRCDNFYFDRLCQVRMPSWTKGRVALVGDAGYCPSPAAGMGGSMAILGAAALADALQNHPNDHRIAFEEYDRNFRPTVEAIQTRAVESGLELFLPRSEEAIQKRNALLGLG